MTREEQILNGFAEMMKGFWNNQNLEVPNLETSCKQEHCDDNRTCNKWSKCECEEKGGGKA